ncbi:hypothetical protein D3C80_1172670 [compost metagenome]
MGRKIDRNWHGMAGAMPDMTFANGSRQYPMCEPGDQACALGKTDELAWAHQAPLRVLPAYQCFHAAHPP